MAKLAGWEKFTKRDFSNAFMLLELDEESRHLTTITTHKGRMCTKDYGFECRRVPAFSNALLKLCQHGENCCVYFDDLFTIGKRK